MRRDASALAAPSSPSTIEPSLAGPWSLGEDAFAEITRDMAAIDPRTIVEFGSGASSVRLALAFPRARIFSFESDAAFLERTRKLARSCGVGADRLELALRPLGFRRVGSAIYEAYAPGPFPSGIDAVLIDGPPHWTKRGREACLHDVVHCLRVGARVYLDDFERPQEQRIVRNWRRCYRDAFGVSELSAGHGVCVLQKLTAVERRISLSVAADSWLVHARRRLHLWRVGGVIGERDRNPRCDRVDARR